MVVVVVLVVAVVFVSVVVVVAGGGVDGDVLFCLLSVLASLVKPMSSLSL